MAKCININHPDYIDLLQESGLHEDILKAKISIWMDENGTDRFPTTDELGIPGKNIESNPELANVIYEALGIGYTLTDTEDKNLRDVDTSKPIITLLGTVIDGNRRLRSGKNIKELKINSYEDLKLNISKLRKIENKQVYKLVELYDSIKNNTINRTYYSEQDISDIYDGYFVHGSKYTNEELFQNLTKKIKQEAPNLGTVITPYQKQQAQQIYFQYLEQNPNGSIEGFKSWVDNKNKQLETQYQLPQGREIEEFVASEKTIRDLAARMSDRIGIPVEFISDRRNVFKGKLEKDKAIINLAYATLDTPIHEILGHPIIRAIKNTKTLTEKEFTQEIYDGKRTLEYGKDILDAFSEYLVSQKVKTSRNLYQNLLKELEYGKGKEVLDRIKRDYEFKNSLNAQEDAFEILDNTPIKSSFYDQNGYPTKFAYRGSTITFKEHKQSYVDEYNQVIPFSEVKEIIDKYKETYTLEEQQEEAIVELLGLYTAEKLDAVKDGKLISLLKKLLKEIKTFVRQLLSQNEVKIDELPDNMTLGDIADLLAYSNSKLILPGNEVVYTTPDNQRFKTYVEASKYISNLAKNVKDIELDNISLERKLSQEDLQKIEDLEKQKKEKEDYLDSKEYAQEKEIKLKNLSQKLEEYKNKKPVFKAQEPSLTRETANSYGFEDYEFVRVESSYSRPDLNEPFIGKPLWKKEFGEDFEGYYIHGYNNSKTKPSTKVLKITKEEAEAIWNEELESYENKNIAALEIDDRNQIYALENKIRQILDDTEILYQISDIKDKIKEIKFGEFNIQGFIEKNKEYEQAKEIIDEWKKINNIQYNPEEVYSRGQEFVSVVGAYSDFDVNLMMQNLLQHIEDNQKAGGEFTVSAFTKPIDRKINHLEGNGGKIKFKIYPQSQDIKWAANTDVYSGSVWDASVKVSKNKSSELLGVSYTKYPNIKNINKIQPNLASIIDNLAHYHNELGITLTGSNFRLEYDNDIQYSTKKIIDSINSILDQKYGKLVKPEIKKRESYKVYEVVDEYYGEELEPIVIKTFNSKIDAESYAKELNDKEGYKNDEFGLKYRVRENLNTKGIQPTQTNETLKESIERVGNKLEVRHIETIFHIYKKDELEIVLDNTQDIAPVYVIQTKKKNTKGFPIDSDFHIFKTEDEASKYIDNQYANLEPIQPKSEYISQALINTKIAKLKEVAKKYPRSLIRSEVRRIQKHDYWWQQDKNLFEPSELPFQKVPSEKLLDNLQFKKGDC